MAYRIELTPRALRDLKGLDKSVQKKAARAIEGLRENPRPSGCRKMEGIGDLYRIRTGDYRVLYQVRDDVLVILVVKVGHRREIYR